MKSSASSTTQSSTTRRGLLALIAGFPLFRLLSPSERRSGGPKGPEDLSDLKEAVDALRTKLDPSANAFRQKYEELGYEYFEGWHRDRILLTAKPSSPEVIAKVGKNRSGTAIVRPEDPQATEVWVHAARITLFEHVLRKIAQATIVVPPGGRIESCTVYGARIIPTRPMAPEYFPEEMRKPDPVILNNTVIS